jgi:predicted RNA binding protein YcfA (HicA-like mRNA interferase family)
LSSGTRRLCLGQLGRACEGGTLTELARLLRSVGAVKVRTLGSQHEVWRVGRCQTVVPHHGTVAAGTLRKIGDQLAPCVGEDWLGQ